MEIILLENVANLGGLGDRVNVKPGYGRNYLVPHGKAVPATAINIAEFESRRAELQKEADAQRHSAETRAAKINALSIRILANAGEEGKLFGSVTVRDIAEEATAAGVEIDRSEIRLPSGPLREVGEYQVEVYLHPEVSAHVSVAVEAEEAFTS
ncbi:MAG: 50S ribosomal protein L9 [Gammaproteobacteria bacterium]|jgi:large subunit ribosomal protein L9|nr:50S ribosomal protein L9 [Gammaproteobacteria bacterium]MBT5053190.1 50S ribosomal protein L9 [Gammaproteobacteria bacterium]MDC0464406.1 50S ribosomal protein L9 [Pseudomonadales bacterium]MDG1114451.1 50S ribosomal protein L9 [Pseudomonadales bacterium]